LPTSVSPGIQVGVSYVLDHASDEMARLGVSQASVASKINAQLGLASIAASTPGQPAMPAAVVAAPTIGASLVGAPKLPVAPVVGAPVSNTGTSA
jgi:hypothetical protein